MVKLFSSTHTYKHPWSTVTSAFWRKYPNPLYPHVQEVDCFNRSLSNGNLTTQRIITATTSFPSFLRAVGAPTLAFGVEQSVVNAANQTLELRSRNVTGSGFMVVEETCTYMPHPDNPEWTLYRQEAEIDATAPVFKSHFEQHGVSRLQQQAQKGLEVMEGLCELVAQEVNSIGDLVQHEMEQLGHLFEFEPASAESASSSTPSQTQHKPPRSGSSS